MTMLIPLLLRMTMLFERNMAVEELSDDPQLLSEKTTYNQVETE